jgi:threonine dehydratase
MRSGLNMIASLSEEDRSRGVVTASSGNHGQAIAYAASVFGVNAIIAVPEGANPLKVQSIRNLGGTVVFHGANFDEARQYVENLAKEEGYKYIHSGNEPALIAGVGTYALEIMEDLPDVDTIIVPIGGGSGASGVCTVAKTINPDVHVIGVQAEKAPGAYQSWKSGEMVEARMETIAEGLATKSGFELPQQVMRKHLDDFVLVSDKEMQRAIVLHLEHTHNLAEHAGAATLAAALKIKDRLAGRKVVLVMSGGNITVDQLQEAIRVYRNG